ncbi:hypothetical protein PCANC_22222 [Puccinia coronata f. sp. avenae]|uniref:Uncharacterized protein n=1 Tax=Puccinia coronata f. sp. avenae TaxID=200324 RepID=A0A2N5SCP5_9BASI|nr:hypothetical protein PCANC_22222 [Puccinia coronata f. sp. avenae]
MSALSRRGGAGAGDPNHPSLKLDPNATYNPFPPQSTYLPKIESSEKPHPNQVVKIIIVIGAIIGLLLFLLAGWALFQHFKRKNRITIDIRRRESFVGTSPFFPRRFRGSSGWREIYSSNDPSHHHSDHPHNDPNNLYGNEAFEMSRDFNRSNVNLPSSYKQQEIEEEGQEEGGQEEGGQEEGGQEEGGQEEGGQEEGGQEEGGKAEEDKEEEGKDHFINSPHESYHPQHSSTQNSLLTQK